MGDSKAQLQGIVLARDDTGCWKSESIELSNDTVL